MDSSFPEAAIGTTQRWLTFAFFSRSTSTTENITHLPDGEICGSLTRFIRCRSAKVIGRFPAEAAEPPSGTTPASCAQPAPHAPANIAASTPARIALTVIATVYPADQTKRQNRPGSGQAFASPNPSKNISGKAVLFFDHKISHAKTIQITTFTMQFTTFCTTKTTSQSTYPQSLTM
jgi:hypothetical protein